MTVFSRAEKNSHEKKQREEYFFLRRSVPISAGVPKEIGRLEDLEKRRGARVDGRGLEIKHCKEN